MSTWGAKSVKILQFPICRVAIRDLRGLPGAGGGKTVGRHGGEKPSGARVGKNLRTPEFGRTFGRRKRQNLRAPGRKPHQYQTNTKPIPSPLAESPCVACKSIESIAWAALEQKPCVPDSHALPSTKNEEHTIIVGRC